MATPNTRAEVRPKYLTLAQAAERCATPAETIRYWIHCNKLAAFKPGRQVLVRETDLEKLIEDSAVSSQREHRAKIARAAKSRRLA